MCFQCKASWHGRHDQGAQEGASSFCDMEGSRSTDASTGWTCRQTAVRGSFHFHMLEVAQFF